MTLLAAQLFITLDGVVQAPGHPDEDRSGGFSHGGWHLEFHNDQVQEWIVRNNTRSGGYLLGRRTYDFFKEFWPKATEDTVGSLARDMNENPKWVVSSTLDEPLLWTNSNVVRPTALNSALRRLKKTTDGDLLLLGSTRLCRALFDTGLIDRLHLILDPLTLGRGARLSTPADGPRNRWRLVENHSTTSGTILLTYDLAGDR